MHFKAEHALVLKFAKPKLYLDFLLKELGLFQILFFWPLCMTEVKKKGKTLPTSFHQFLWLGIYKDESECLHFHDA